MKPYDAIRIETDRNIITNKTRICAVRFLLGGEVVQSHRVEYTLDPGDTLTIAGIDGQIREVVNEPINKDYYVKI